jgi:addiction module RelE/StbE family toxin
MEIISHRAFVKAYAKLPAEKKTAVDEALLRFAESRVDPVLHDHALKGRMKGLRAFSAGFDLRIIYRDEGGFITITLLDVGTHNQVY